MDNVQKPAPDERDEYIMALQEENAMQGALIMSHEAHIETLEKRLAEREKTILKYADIIASDP